MNVSERYKKIPEDEINDQEDGVKAAVMVMANMTLGQAAKQASGEELRQPQVYDCGWKITLHDQTETSAVGLWSCWLGNQFYLGYPKQTAAIVDSLSSDNVVKIANQYRAENPKQFWNPDTMFDYRTSRRVLIGMTEADLQVLLERHGISMPKVQTKDVPDELVMKILGVEPAESVPHPWDAAKPTVWAKFWGPKVEKGGRVWVGKSDFDSYGHHLPIITKDGELVEVYFGHDMSRGIRTAPFSHFNEKSPESPTADPLAIQAYRSKFLELLVDTSLLFGTPTKVSVSYETFAMVPEDLAREGYQNITWLKGGPDKREGWGNELVKAEKPGETIMLRSANSVVPWVTVRQLDIPASKQNKEDIYELVQGVLKF